MKQNLVLPAASLLAIVLASFHLVDDVVYGSDKSMTASVVMVAALAVWLYGTLVLPERLAGLIIMLLGSLIGLTVFYVHLSGAGGLEGIHIGKMSGPFFFVWTLLALAVVSLLSLERTTMTRAQTESIRRRAYLPSIRVTLPPCLIVDEGE